MDRRSVTPPDAEHPRLGWPGVSCEVWGAHGAFGGEVYGWGAVMPAHLVRNLVGLRETDDPHRAILAPGFPSSLASPGTEYAVERIPWHGHSLSIRFRFLDQSRIQAVLSASGPLAIRAVDNQQQQSISIHRDASAAVVELVNFGLYTLTFAEPSAR
jgi:hypothetical protein